MARIPLMIAGDSPASSTGLGRILRDMSLHVHTHLSETFELATLGLGGHISKQFPWQQYQIHKLENWAVVDLPRVWKDHAGDKRGIILFIWNPSWLPWLADPKKLPKGDLRSMLESKPFETWLYAPIDADGPNGRLSLDVSETLKGFDRVLAYTRWSAELIERSIYTEDDYRKIPYLPHGVDTKVFYPRNKAEAKRSFLRRVTGEAPKFPLNESTFMIGIVATNSARKDWGIAMEACQELLRRGINVGLWAHTESLKGHWDILGLADAYGMSGRVIPSNIVLGDDDMAWAYSAMEVTFGIGSEGWGLPAGESLACGVPVVTGGYAGCTDFVPKEYWVKPVGFYHDGFYGNRRPVFDPNDWALATLRATETKAVVPERIKWDVCWKEWEKWFLAGVNG